jgi:lipopolysaccharide assembly outer membrane protein LptD (OstA)
LGLCVAAWVAGWQALPAAADRSEIDEQPFEITADVIEYERGRELFEAEGDVRIVQEGGRSLEADWVVFSNRTRRGIASGDVVLVDAEERLEGEFVEFDVDTLQGLVFDGRIRTGNFRIWAEELVKTGEDTYQLGEGGLTTCDCPEKDWRDPWRIETEKADVRVGGYGTVRNATVDVLGVPVIWLPWMIYPVKTERQSGILFPDFAFGGRNGFEVGLPLFWAAGDPVNLLLTPRYLTERGFKPDLEVEYVLGRESDGELFLSYIHDRDVISDSEALRHDKNPDTFSSNRWGLRWQSDTHLPLDWRLAGDVKFVSDNRYPADFQDFRSFRRDRYLESQLFGFRHYLTDGSLGAVGSVLWADDLQNPDDVDRDDFVLQRLPDLSASWLRTPLPQALGLVAAVDLDYTHFRPRQDPENSLRVSVAADPSLFPDDDRFLDTGFDGISNRLEESRRGRITPPDPPPDAKPFDFHGDNYNPSRPNNPKFGPEGDGIFQEGEPLTDRGHRFDLHPRIARPMRFFDLLDFYPELGYRETPYTTSSQNSAERGMWTARADLGLRAHRRFERGEGSSLTHWLEPRLGWALARTRNQAGNPFFVPPTALPQHRIRQLARDNLVLDPSDQVVDTNRLVLGLGNRFWSQRGGGASQLLADFELSGDYDFQRGGMGRLVLDGRSFRIARMNTHFHLTYDPEEGHIDEGLMDVNLRLPFDANLGARYRYLRRIPLFFESFKGELDRFKDADPDSDRVSQVDGTLRIPIGESLALGYTGIYSIEDDLLLSNRGTIEYISRCKCWAIQFELNDHRTLGLQYSVRYTLLGLGDDRANPFAGKTPYGSATQLP